MKLKNILKKLFYNKDTIQYDGTSIHNGFKINTIGDLDCSNDNWKKERHLTEKECFMLYNKVSVLQSTINKLANSTSNVPIRSEFGDKEAFLETINIRKFIEDSVRRYLLCGMVCWHIVCDINDASTPIWCGVIEDTDKFIITGTHQDTIDYGDYRFIKDNSKIGIRNEYICKQNGIVQKLYFIWERRIEGSIFGNSRLNALLVGLEILFGSQNKVNNSIKNGNQVAMIVSPKVSNDNTFRPLEDNITKKSLDSMRSIKFTGAATYFSQPIDVHDIEIKDMDYEKTYSICQDEIYNMYEVDLTSVSLNNATSNNVQFSQKRFYEDTVKPLMDKLIIYHLNNIFNQMDTIHFKPREKYFDVDIEALNAIILRENFVNWGLLSQIGFMTGNEARKIAGMEEDERFNKPMNDISKSINNGSGVQEPK